MPNVDKPQLLAVQNINATNDTYIPTLQEFIALSKRNGFSRTDRFAVGFFPPGTMSTGPWDLKDLALLCEEASFPTKTLNTRTLRIHGLNEQRAHTLDYGGESISFTFIVDQSWQTRLFFEEWMRLCIGRSVNNDVLGIGTTDGPFREIEFYDNYIQNIQISAFAPMGSDVPLPPITTNGLLSSANLLSSAKAFVTSGLNTLTGGIQGNILGKSLSGIAQGLLGDAESAVFPIDTKGIPEQPTTPAEYPIYNILLRECFPKSIEAQQMSSSSINQYHRLKVTFAYKYYTTTQQLPEHINDPLA